MSRVVALLALGLVLPSVVAVQELAVLRVRIVLAGDGVPATPIRRHLLLVSDNPASAPPKRLFTADDGTATVRLPPGNYTVESDQPVAFNGRAYQWTRSLDVVAGSETVLDLTTGNADAVAAGAAVAAASALDEDASSLAARWQASVVAVWTPTAHASGAVVDAAGLVVTNQQPIGAATSVEVQFSPVLKVTGQVIVTDAERDIAVVRIDAATAATVPSLPLACGEPQAVPAQGDEIFAIETPLREPTGTLTGIVRRVATRVIETDLLPGRGGAGGPVFSTRGAVLGITSEGDERMRQNDADTRIVRTGELCAAVELARSRMAGAAAPASTPLPVEPVTPFPTDGLGDGASLLARRPPFTAMSSGFDITFLTPVQVFGGLQQRVAAGGRTMSAGAAWLRLRTATEFANWADYVADVPPLLFIRVTPKLVESVWAKLARGAAYTQGVALPPLARPSSGFSRMRVFCGDTPVTPVHPFVLRLELSDSETLSEGLYALSPDALSPACGSVRLELYAQKDPAKADTVTIDGTALDQIWADFAPYRAQP